MPINVHEDLTLLSRPGGQPPERPDQATLQSFPNKYPDRDYSVEFDCPEFTSLCPITGQPDFARIKIRYIPHQKCLESKSLKFYLFSFRNVGMFHEEITNKILDDLVAVCQPRWALVRGIMNPRGGISIDVTAEYSMDGYRLTQTNSSLDPDTAGQDIQVTPDHIKGRGSHRR